MRPDHKVNAAKPLTALLKRRNGVVQNRPILGNNQG
jgi:hypothetical protein